VNPKYDVFISCKNLDEAGEPTRDLALAQIVFEILSAQGLQVFFSNISLESLGVAAYKRAIDDALDATTLLVVVGTSADNLNSRWVRYEWDGFYNDILSGVKPHGKVFAYVEGVGVTELPRALRQTQCFQHDDSATHHLLQFVSNAIAARNQADSSREEERTEESRSCVVDEGPSSGRSLNERSGKRHSKSRVVLHRSASDKLHERSTSNRHKRSKSSARAVAISLVAVFLFLAIGAVMFVRSQNAKMAVQEAALAASQMRERELVENKLKTERRATAQREQAAQRLVDLQKQFAATTAYAKSHPDDYEEIFARCEKLRQSALGTEYEKKAEELAAGYRKNQSERIDVIMTALETRSAALLEHGKLSEAENLIRSYAGPLSAESESQREALAATLKQRLARVATVSPSNTDISTIANAFLRLDFDKAGEELVNAGATPPIGVSSAQWPDVRAMALSVATMPKLIRESFEKDIGKNISVKLRGGTVHVNIMSIKGTKVSGREMIRRSDGVKLGSTTRNFDMSELSLQEQFRRLGKKSTPALNIMRGLLAYAGKAEKSAKQYFEKSNSDLGQIFSKCIVAARAEQKSAILARNKACTEAAATKAYDSLLKTAGISTKEKTPDEQAKTIGKTKFSRRQVERVQRALEHFLSQYRSTAIATTYKKVIETLANIRPNMPLSVSRDVLDAALAQLQKDNPGNVICHKSEIEDDGIVLDFGGEGSLVNISALRGLPLKSLNLSCTPVADLRPLKNMPLRRLDLNAAHAAHPNLSQLRGLPLKWLNIRSGSQHGGLVCDLEPLKGMQLEYLNASEHSETGNWRIHDLSPLEGMPLKHLDLYNCRAVSDLSPLEDLPLEYLNIVRTGVTDISPLKNSTSLKKLDR